jgi:hypothetical protein
MALLSFIDVTPNPVGPAGIGVLAVVILFVVGFIGLLAAALVVFLWLRKRGLRGSEMIRPDVHPAVSPVQVNSPNQP